MRKPWLPLLLLPVLLLCGSPAEGYSPRLAGRFEFVLADTDVSLYGVRMFKDGTAYLCGADGTFVTSTDGGKKWTARCVEENLSLHTMSWHDERIGLLAGRKNRKNRILLTTDGGKSFAGEALDLDFPVTGFAFLDRNHGWLVSGSAKEADGAWRETTDGGRTFHEPADAEYRLPARALFAVTAIDKEKIVAVGTHVEVSWVGGAAKNKAYQTRRGGVLRSEDGGKTWSVQDAGNPAGTALYGVSFLDANQGWVVGDGGFAAKTADGGKTWKKVATGVTARLQAVDMIDAKTVFAVGANGTAVGTNDGGESVAILKTPDKSDLRACSFSGPEKGFAVGRGGASWRFVREW